MYTSSLKIEKLIYLYGTKYPGDSVLAKVAYFSLETAVDPRIPTYSGGLGVLAGDTLRSAADMGLPVAAVSLTYRNGYFEQVIKDGRQLENYPDFHPGKHMKDTGVVVQIPMQGRNINVKAWQYDVKGQKGTVPVFFLDTHDVENFSWDKKITSTLYGGDHQYHRIAQEMILGMAGVRVLEKMGIRPQVYHLNEGHGAFAPLELMRKYGKDAAKDKTVFTTHTPVPAGHDKFCYCGEGGIDDMLRNINPIVLRELAGSDCFNTTLLALNMSRKANSVAAMHGHVSREMFPGYDIGHITNGVHAGTWLSDSSKELYDKHIPGWQSNPTDAFARARDIPLDDIVAAHRQEKAKLVDYINTKAEAGFNEDDIIIGFARRFATYKRADLIFSDIERLSKASDGRLQIVMAGKAHPKDDYGKAIIEDIHNSIPYLKEKGINVVFLENYDMDLGKLLTSGSDVWLNTPIRPMEASGTSGMKAAMNAVPHLSTYDGWWCEADGGGWTIGPKHGRPDNVLDARSLYDILENSLMPQYYQNGGKKFHEIARDAVLNASFFNTHRMVDEYAKDMWNLSLRQAQEVKAKNRVILPHFSPVFA